MNVAVANGAKRFGVFFDRYYWLTTLLIAQNGVGRQYRNSFLGILWTVMQPLVQVGIYAFIMPIILHVPVENYPYYLICGLPLWGFISSALSGAQRSILSQAQTLKRCMVSSTVFPVADVLQKLYTYCVSFGIMYGVASVLMLKFDPIVLLLPLYLLPIVVIIMALSIAIAFVAPYVRDVGEAIVLLMNIMFWLTPIIYPLAAVPVEFHVWYEFNPFYIMISPIQQLAFAHTLPDAASLWRLFALLVVSVAGSYAVYNVCRRNYVYYL